MIDTAVLAWGKATPTPDAVRVRRPSGVRGLEDFAARFPASPPVYLDWNDLRSRLGSPDGELRQILYKESAALRGHWKVGDVELLYTDGRIELRASLPKLLTGDNAAVLDETGVKHALTKLVALGNDIAGTAWVGTPHARKSVPITLDLASAVPRRLDYCYQWHVASVAFAFEHLKASFAPSRKVFHEIISPQGGRTLTWGYGGAKRTIRFYDKGAEVTEKLTRAGELRRVKSHRVDCRCSRCGTSPYPHDTILRFEIQDREHNNRLRCIHEKGYAAADIRGELNRVLSLLRVTAIADLETLLVDATPERVGTIIRSLWLREHPEAWAVLRKHLPRPTYYRWRKLAREFELGTADWVPKIPDEAFEPGTATLTARSV